MPTPSLHHQPVPEKAPLLAVGMGRVWHAGVGLTFTMMSQHDTGNRAVKDRLPSRVFNTPEGNKP